MPKAGAALVIVGAAIVAVVWTWPAVIAGALLLFTGAALAIVDANTCG